MRASLEPPVSRYRDKYDEQKTEAAHYSKYLARLALNAYLKRAKHYREAVEKQKPFGHFPRLRKETGELNYNPIFGSYRARKTWIRPYPHIQNILDPTFYGESIEGRMRRARRDFYLNQIKRIGPLIDTLLEPGPGQPRQPDAQECSDDPQVRRLYNLPACKHSSEISLQVSDKTSRFYRKKSYWQNSRKKGQYRSRYHSRHY